MKLLVLFFLLSALAPAAKPQSLFDGQTLAQWEGSPGVWRVEDGTITASIPLDQTLAKNEFLYWKGTASDFDLSLQYRLVGGATTNSGIQIRSRKDDSGHAVGYQCDLDDGSLWLGRIYDEHGRGLIAERGALTKIAPDGTRHSFPFSEPAPLTRFTLDQEWNHYLIKARGPRIEIHLNGIHFTTLEDHQHGEADLAGLIALQLHSGPGPAQIQFRDIELTSYDQNPAKPLTVDGPGRLASSPLLWHLKPNPAGEKGDITSRMHVPEGFRIDTIAREPRLRQPIAFTFDSRGRIWIAEAFAYPRRRSADEASDRIIILEDTDHNGSFETRKVFADKLNLISGFEIGYGGVFAACAPEFIFIPDADGNDIPDGPPEVLLDGFSINDTHETPNSFLWGHDGYLYGCHGVFNPSLVGKPGTPREDRLKMNAAVWRFHPVTRDFEIYSHGGSNQWGLDYGPDGSLFMTHCRSSWGLGPVSQVFRDGHYWTQNNANYRDFIATAKQGWNRVNAPLFNYFDSISAYGHGEGGAGEKGSRAIFGGHSHVGTMVYLGDNWPAEYRGDLFTHNLHGHQLNRETLTPRDSAFLASSHGQDTLYCPDPRYLAVDLKYGPDGAVYAIDWQDTQQCHVNDAARWDRSNGRLYRMSYEPTYKPARFKDLAEANPQELLAHLTHDNEWFARMAQHQLRQQAARGKNPETLAPALRAALFDSSHLHRFRHLVALDATGSLTPADIQRLLQDPDETIRNHTLHLITNRPGIDLSSISAILLNLARSDPSPRVLLTLAGACQHRLPEELRLPILFTLANSFWSDRFLPKMVWFGLATNAGDQPILLAQLALARVSPLLRDSILWHLAQGQPDFALSLANQFTETKAITRAAAVISQALDGRKLPVPASWNDFAAKAGATGDAETIAHLGKLNAIFGLADEEAVTVAERAHQAANAFAICAACHQPSKDQPGPSLEEISQIYNTKEAIIAWIKNPQKKRENYPQMPAFDKLDARTLELSAEHLLRVRNGASGTSQDTKKILFLAGRDSHGWGTHQHHGGTMILARGMRESALPVEVRVIREWPADEMLYQQDAFVIYADGWGAHPANGKLDSLQKFMDQGGGLTVIHWATGLGSPDAGNKAKDHSADPVRRQWRNLVGADFEPWHSVSRFWDASFETLPKHPVTRGVSPFVIHDECYFHLRCTDPEHKHLTPLHGALPPAGLIQPGRSMDSGSESAVEAVTKGEDQYCAWGFQRPAGGRTFGFTGGHTHWNWGRDELRKLILNGIYWTSGAEVPAQGISSTRPSADEMLEHLEGNPGWTTEGLQILLDRAGEGELIKWTRLPRGPLPVGPQPPQKARKDRGPGLILEGEGLKILKVDGSVEPQNMQPFGAGIWSGDAQLWWTAGKEKAALEVEFVVPKAGNYHFHFAGTKAIDYGIHSLALNGESTGKSIDFFQPAGVSHTGQIHLGEVSLKAGKNSLTVTATGTHPDAVKRYMFGLDFLRLAPVE